MKTLNKIILVGLFQLLTSCSLSAQFWELLFEPFIFQGIYTAVIAGPNEPTWRETTFASFPYDAPESGLFLPTTLEGDQSRIHTVVHFQNNERALSGGLVQIKYAPISMLTIEGNYLHLFGQVDDVSTNISITYFNVSYNRLRHHRIHAWWGLGGIFLKDQRLAVSDNQAFSFNLGINYYFKEPMSLYLEAQMGNINEAFGAISQARLQVHLDRFLIYAGYQDVNFGALEYNGVAIGGGVYF